MRLLVTAIALGVMAALSRAGRAPAQPPLPSVSFALAKDRFLSTEEPSGSLTVANRTSETVYYSRFAVYNVVRDASGKTFEEPLERQYSIHFYRDPVAPRESRTFEVRLPACEVLSDPCTVRLELKVYLSGGGKGMPFALPSAVYTLIPDPDATFRGTGLHENLPLFLTQGEASGAILPRDLEIAFQFSAPEQKHLTDPAEAAGVVSAFDRHGMRPEHRFVDDRQGFQIRVLLRNQKPGPDVDAAVADIERQFGSRVSVASIEFVPNPEDLMQLARVSTTAAAARAERVLHYFEEGQVQPVYGPGLRGFLEIGTMKRGQDGSKAAFFPLLPLDWSRMEERSAQLEALAIRIRDTAGFAGDAPMRALRHAEDGDPQYAGADLSAVAVLPVRAEIAADRPEIYAVAGTTTQQADRLGYQPAALALSLALRRANALAAELGVATQWISLAAEYPSAVISNFSTVRAAGIALTPQGTLDAAWQRLVPAPAPSVSLPAASAPQPSPTPAPFASREPFSVTHYDAAPYAIPIELSDWQSRLVVEADRAVPVIADRFRLSIAVGNADVQQRRALPSPASVKRALSAEAFVEDVAVQASGEGLPVGYQILVKVGSNSISRVVDRVRSAYGSSGVTYKFDVKAELEDCEAPLERAQQLSLDEALHSAIAQARDENKLLRHLVVAAAYPPSLGDGETCEPHARPESLNIPTQPVLEIPSLKLTAHAPIELAFRTGSPPTAVAAALPRP